MKVTATKSNRRGDNDITFASVQDMEFACGYGWPMRRK